MYEIKDHLLKGKGGDSVSFKEATGKMTGVIKPKYLVMHFTAGSSFESSVSALTSPDLKASAHLVIGRDGASVAQLVPLNKGAWHAGVSSWQGIEGLNRHSIGIELDNAGALERHGSKWRAWFGKEYPGTEVLEARHRNESAMRGWHIFPPRQIETALAIARLLVNTYGLLDVIGHDDIAPTRKTDPGPAFPMASFRAMVLGRADDRSERFEAVAALNIREGAGIGFAKLPASPLPIGTRLALRERQGKWCFVDMLGADGKPSLTGWVHGDFIKPA